MSGDVDEGDRLARVTLSRAIEPGDLRVTGLVSELGAGKVLGYLEAAAEVESYWGFGIAHEFGLVDPAQVLEQAAARGIRFIVPGDAEWPTQLGALRGAGALHGRGGEPVGLWVLGSHDLRQLAGNAIAVVGSRAATSYGTEQATELGRDLATMGHTVISGAAFGVDQAAHRGALLADGPTIAVMPCGVDRPYPAAHAQLLEAIAERGLVVSEAPPGRRTNPNPLPGTEQDHSRPRRGHRGRRRSRTQRRDEHRPLDHQPAPGPHGRTRPRQQRGVHRSQPADPPRLCQRGRHCSRRHHRRHDPRRPVRRRRCRPGRRVIPSRSRAVAPAGGLCGRCTVRRSASMTPQRLLWITRFGSPRTPNLLGVTPPELTQRTRRKPDVHPDCPAVRGRR